jgi:hypothetical protein
MIQPLLLALAALAAAAAPVDPARPPAEQEVQIPFADFGEIRSFQAWSDDVVYLQDRHDQWYKARLLGPCYGLSWAMGIGVDTGGGPMFDRFSRLIVGRELCSIQSLTRTGKPQRPGKKHN